MAGDAPNATFTAGRANLRETAKWMVSGSLAGATLIIGSSTFSQLGSLEGWRLGLALVTLLAAVALCWAPFSRAVEVLRSDLLNLEDFAKADAPADLRAALAKVDAHEQPLPEAISLAAFALTFDAICDAAEAAAGTPRDKKAMVDALIQRRGTYVQECASQLVVDRFDALRASIAFPGALIACLFVIFTFVANPPKPDMMDKPYLVPVTTALAAQLETWGVASPCAGPDSQLLVTAELDHAPREALLIPAAADGGRCAVRKLKLAPDRILEIE
jgi:hypothetical protein